ncbi:alpha/beta fold hydrolase [Thermosipho ferrireducens]|uniref:Alpha/beta fold hydrolase n=1 Tax=Thermosipho ferrireducens TaxID=2571116 RepID=A0ABX7S4B1_9BACT|nr:esterase EstD [Thermosipho ferrireducens]QTA37273.1 alpha/beta fold hydrolase [Thermosipho ferrireducens]
MKKIILIVILLTQVFGFSFKFQDEAFTYLEFLAKENFRAAYDMSDEIMRKQLDVNKLKNIWENVILLFGDYKKILKVNAMTKGEYEVYIFTCNFEKENALITISVNKKGEISGLFFKKADEKILYRLPEYVDKDKFVEKDVQIGKYKLPGKLTIPKGEGKFPAVVLISGSGPNDMDVSIGPNKIFKDIAYGLSTNGVVTLRFHKRTYVLGSKMNIEKLTVKEEIIDDVNAAINYLKNLNYVKNIYLLGHSLGAYIAPYIANKNKNIDGVVLLAPPARNLEDLMYDQLIYLKNFQDINKELLEKIDKLRKEVMDESEIIFGATVKYYYDLRNYNPINYLRGINAFLLFGERDYQVTKKEEEIYRKYFPDLKIKVYPGLNHLFIEGKGVPNPYEYFKEGHVSEKVIKDIYYWIKEAKK